MLAIIMLASIMLSQGSSAPPDLGKQYGKGIQNTSCMSGRARRGQPDALLHVPHTPAQRAAAVVHYLRSGSTCVRHRLHSVGEGWRFSLEHNRSRCYTMQSGFDYSRSCLLGTPPCHEPHVHYCRQPISSWILAQPTQHQRTPALAHTVGTCSYTVPWLARDGHFSTSHSGSQGQQESPRAKDMQGMPAACMRKDPMPATPARWACTLYTKSNML
jgi:hypothetical protein